MKTLPQLSSPLCIPEYPDNSLSLVCLFALLTGGTAARASEINTETAYALNLFNTPQPVPIEELLVTMPHAGVCLVDHQQVSQLNKSIDVSHRSRDVFMFPYLLLCYLFYVFEYIFLILIILRHPSSHPFSSSFLPPLSHPASLLPNRWTA